HPGSLEESREAALLAPQRVEKAQRLVPVRPRRKSVSAPCTDGGGDPVAGPLAPGGGLPPGVPGPLAPEGPGCCPGGWFWPAAPSAALADLADWVRWTVRGSSGRSPRC